MVTTKKANLYAKKSKSRLDVHTQFDTKKKNFPIFVSATFLTVTNKKSNCFKIYVSYLLVKYLIQIYSYIRIFSVRNIRSYHIRIIFLYEYIRIFVRIIFLIRIYSDIRSYCFFDTNIFGYSFVLFFSIRIYSDIRSYQNFIFVTLWSVNPPARERLAGKGGFLLPHKPSPPPSSQTAHSQLLHPLPSGASVLSLSIFGIFHRYRSRLFQNWDFHQISNT